MSKHTTSQKYFPELGKNRKMTTNAGEGEGGGGSKQYLRLQHFSLHSLKPNTTLKPISVAYQVSSLKFFLFFAHWVEYTICKIELPE